MIVAVRTRSDQREVLVWLSSPEELRALLELLPVTTTPEFQERKRQHEKFRENLKAIAPRAPPVTPAIVGVNVALFVIMLAFGAGLTALDSRVHLLFGANYGPLTWNGQEWRLLTAAFIHFGVIHLAFNMFALYNGGSITERLFGSARFAVIYLLSAVAGNVASGWWDASRLSAGASGAVFGVYGALLAYFARRPRDIPVDVLKSVSMGAGTLLLYSLVMGAVLPFIDNSAHIGGLLGGAISGIFAGAAIHPGGAQGGASLAGGRRGDCSRRGVGGTCRAAALNNSGKRGCHGARNLPPPRGVARQAAGVRVNHARFCVGVALVLAASAEVLAADPPAPAAKVEKPAQTPTRQAARAPLNLQVGDIREYMMPNEYRAAISMPPMRTRPTSWCRASGKRHQ